MIRFERATFSYRPVQPVLADVTVEIGRGLTLLLGPNGAGKSTLLKLAAGVERPDSGSVSIDGRDLWRDEVVARRTLAYVSEQPDLTPYATIGDVLSLVCRLRAEPPSEARAALDRCGLATLSGRSIRELSMGQRRRAVLGAAWIGSPTHVVLDEPLEGMDRAIREQILDWVDRLLSEQAVVVLATHDIEPFADRAVRAVAVGGGKCRICEPLPGTGAARMAYLEALSRGSADFAAGGKQ